MIKTPFALKAFVILALSSAVIQSSHAFDVHRGDTVLDAYGPYPKKATVIDVTPDGLVRTSLSGGKYFKKDTISRYRPVSSKTLHQFLGKFLGIPDVTYKIGDTVFFKSGPSLKTAVIKDLTDDGLVSLDISNGSYYGLDSIRPFTGSIENNPMFATQTSKGMKPLETGSAETTPACSTGAGVPR